MDYVGLDTHILIIFWSKVTWAVRPWSVESESRHVWNRASLVHANNESVMTPIQVLTNLWSWKETEVCAGYAELSHSNSGLQDLHAKLRKSREISGQAQHGICSLDFFPQLRENMWNQKWSMHLTAYCCLQEVKGVQLVWPRHEWLMPTGHSFLPGGHNRGDATRPDMWCNDG